MPTILPDGTEVATPEEAAKAALANAAKEQMENALEREARRRIYAFLPKFLHPLVPGTKGTVGGELKKEAEKRVWAAVGSCLFSLVFFGLVAAVLLFVVLAIVWGIFFG